MIATPFNRMEGLASIRAIPSMLGQMFARTLHQVTSQQVAIVGDNASGETKSYANHITVHDDGTATNENAAAMALMVRPLADKAWAFANESMDA